MQIMQKPEAFSILTTFNEYLDWHDRSIYAEQLRRYGYFVEADEMENKIPEGEFYELLDLFLSEFKPDFYH
jgi:hypothetical protein